MTTTATTDARAVTGLVTELTAQAAHADLMRQVLEQDTYWVPKAAWAGFLEASLHRAALRGYLGELEGEDVFSGDDQLLIVMQPDFTVDGVLRVADMPADHRANVVRMLWNQSVQLCQGLSLGTLLGGMPNGELACDAVVRSEVEYARLERDEPARRAWFDRFALVKALRA